MCGRYGDVADESHWQERFGVPPPDGWRPRPQIAPTDPIVVVGPGPAVIWARWGLVPPWARSETGAGHGVTINARWETLGKRPAFRYAITHRGVTPATHYFEWRTEAGRRQPYLIRRRDFDVMALAVVVNWWRDPAHPKHPPRATAAIVTRAADSAMSGLHDRMPLAVTGDLERRWLERDLPFDQLESALLPGSEELTAIPVGSGVNRVANTGAEILDPTGPPLF